MKRLLINRLNRKSRSQGYISRRKIMKRMNRMMSLRIIRN